MPTREVLAQFWRDWHRLTPAEQRRFRHGFRSSLRVKGVQGAEGVFELTWAPDGRATFHYGEPVVEGEPHIVWRRIGTHEIFGAP